MPRELRKRTNRVSYLIAYPGLQDEVEDEIQASQPSSSKAPQKALEDYAESIDGSGSDFAPTPNGSAQEDEDEGVEEDEEDEAIGSIIGDGEDDDEFGLESTPFSTQHTVQVKGKGTAGVGKTHTPLAGSVISKISTSKANIALAAPRDAGIQSNAPPSRARLSSSTIGHVRPWPLYTPPGRPRHLTRTPQLFDQNLENFQTLTVEVNDHPTIRDRITKAWAHDLGNGPVWELVEDKASYPECYAAHAKEPFEESMDIDSDFQESPSSESTRSRPRVYRDVRVETRATKLLETEYATKYLPRDIKLGHDSSGEQVEQPGPSQPIPCYFGPYGSQKRTETSMFESHQMNEFIDGSRSHVFNAGAPVWGLDWCPIHETDSIARAGKQYLAVAPYPSRDYNPTIGSRTRRPSPACIQIWSLAPTDPDDIRPDDVGVVTCEMVVCIDSGPANEIKWCPLPAHDSWQKEFTPDFHPRKLGILAGTFGDGSLTFWIIPDPEDMRRASGIDRGAMPVYVHIAEPLLRIELADTALWSFDWANSELIAVGGTNGNIAVYHIKDALTQKETAPPLPSMYIPCHQTAVRSLTWIRVPPHDSNGKPRPEQHPSMIASVSYDGVIMLTDIRDQTGTMLIRTRDTLQSVEFAPYAGGFITVELDVVVKWYNLSPNILGRGHGILDAKGPIWSLSASDYHPFVAAGSADGTCYTTSLYKTTRRGTTLPMFVHKIFQMDFNRNTQEYRMMEKFLPFELSESRASQTRKESAKRAESTNPEYLNEETSPRLKFDREGSGAWPPEVGIHRVVWNTSNGMAKCQLLASATASGLCRIDNLWGRFYRDRVPYGSVEKLRGGEEGPENELSDDA